MECKVFKKCGGCTFNHKEYERTLKEKEKYLNELLNLKIGSITGMDDPYYYRNKVHQALDSSRIRTYPFISRKRTSIPWMPKVRFC